LQSLDVPLSKLFPELFSIFRPVITLEVPVIVAASILADYESPILPVRKGRAPPGVDKEGVKLFKAIGGQQVIRLLVKSKPEDYQKILWAPCSTIGMWLGAVEFDDGLGKLLKVFELTGFGDARVNAPVPPHGLVTLEEVVSLYRKRKLRCGLGVKEISSEAISIDPDTPLIEAMRTMCDKRVRRLFLRGRTADYVSDRSILAFLFSPRILRVAKDQPESWTSAKVSEVQSTTARSVSPNAKVEDVGRMAEAGRDVFMLSDGLSLLSRWDLVMKPWRAGQLHLSR
jgi:CBS domain-containing protein